jgi:hypothetical protein
MIKPRNGIAPFSGLVLEAIILVRRGDVPVEGENSLNLALIQFLNDKGYIKTNGGSFDLSEKGFKIYNELLDLVATEINVVPAENPV